MSFRNAHPLLQASAVPYRYRDEAPEFCLITSFRGGRWGFPKGISDPGETPLETALKEADEEAGLHGRIEGDPLGEYEYSKWGTVLAVTVYLMRVTAVDEDWEEAGVRRRRWCRAGEAREMLHREELRGMLDAAMERIGRAGG